MIESNRTHPIHAHSVRIGLTVCTLLSGLALLGCGTDQSDAPTTTSAVAGAADRPTFDPPKVFAERAVSKLNIPEPKRWSQECTLHDGTAICASRRGALIAVDAPTGKPMWQVSPAVSPISTSQGRDHGVLYAPIVHGDSVIAAFGGVVPATGTVPEKAAIEVVAAEVGTGRRLWDTIIDLGPASGVQKQLPISTFAQIKVVAVTDTAVVVTGRTQAGNRDATWVLDPKSHQIRWQADEFVAEYADNHVVVGDGKAGTGDKARRGRSIEDGHELWSTGLGGDSTQYLTSRTPGAAFIERYKAFELLDPVTGAARYSMTDPSADSLQKTWRCMFDQQQIVVCQNNTRILGFDLTDPAKTLWEFGSDNNRVPPTMTAAYHGVLYGLNSSGKAVALDARTGQDLPTSPVIAPTLVDRYVGIAAVDVPGTFPGGLFHETTGWVHQPTA
ncbi:outer membrane assembly lipoprotein YfgL [Nocardia otitidiscaviarum]|uniref:Outer membrane assembly lipoprotein YfgL n=1 Tax=Nocardia otitidiscaviarum TaxID=1823 RepID=A0A378Y8Q5_9NOCA|nr:PQQ-binding-like beta-propeller repeat protein [Nocardia otitidiscaviarum]SUA72881.1 outer membrane assembly lipoprotein YfgL [Nocardia otitidiscaviarum]